MREAADYIIDTSYLAPSQLKQRLSNLFLGNVSGCAYHSNYVIWLQNGIPTEADMMFDVQLSCQIRFMCPELKKINGFG